MEITRKGFIASVTAAAGAAVVLPSAQAVAGVLAVRQEIAQRFSDHIGSTFELSAPTGARGSVVLSGVVKAKSCRRTEQFSLVFTPVDGAALPEGNYGVRHAGLGSFDLFVTPTVNEPGLRADFNQLRA